MSRVTHGEALIWAMLGNCHRKRTAPPLRPGDVLPRPRRSETNWKAAQMAFWAMGKKHDRD